MRLQLVPALAALVIASGAEGARADEGWRISSDTLFYTDTDNVVVVSPQASISRALDSRGGSASARVVVDVVSAASVDVISHATTRFAEVRTEADLGVSRAFGKNLPSLSYRYSHENDYTSHGFGAGFSRDLAGADTNLALNYDVAFDTVGYTGTPRAGFSEGLISHAFTGTLTQVLGPRTLLRGVYTLTAQLGYMAKPYRFVALFDQAGIDAARAAGVSLDLETFDRYRLAARPVERVPDERVGHAFGLRFMRYLDALSGSLRLDGQGYVDSWGLVAGTVEAAVSWKLSERTVLAGYGRVYVQNGATFWRREYVVADGQVPRWRTADRDLSPYTGISAGVRYERHGAHLHGYVDVSAMDTLYRDYLFLTSRLALITEAGLRLEL